MATAIIKINDHHFKRETPGTTMDLMFERDQWAMYTVNATVRAYNRGIATPKFFKDLKAVEDKYKTWKGIVALAA